MKRSLVLCCLLLFPVVVSASQFVKLPFDEVARGATLVVRGTMGPVTSGWDDEHQIIYSSAQLEVSRYIAGFGPNVLQVREIGGTVGGYTQEAIGFPVLQEGQEVVLFLTRWDDSSDWRIHEYSQGKYSLRQAGPRLIVAPDSMTQGADQESIASEERAVLGADMSFDEFVSMVQAARRGETGERERPRK